MKVYLINFLLTLPFFTPVTTTTHRRILHQPLFPGTSTPPPPETTSDNPFFHEHTPDQPPPPPDTVAEQVAYNNTATHLNAPTPAKKSGEKIAVVVSVVVVTLIIMSGLVFFIYKYKAKKYDNTTTVRNVGTAESLRTETELTNGSLNGSPYYKLNSVKSVTLSDRYRPSPELQPLPPLTKLKPAKPPAAVSDEDEEVYDFTTPHGSIASIDDGYFVGSLNSKRIHYSKKSSPRSRFSVSSPETTSEKHSPAKQPPQQKPKLPIPPQPSAGLPMKNTSTSMSPSAKVIPKIMKPMSSHNDDLQADGGSKPKPKPLD